MKKEEYSKLSLREKMDLLVEEMIEKKILLNDAKKEFEKLYIEKILKKHKRNISKAAQVLGLHRNTLQSKAKSLKIKK
ncbi:MAG: helix-turn-helix domain-containing protein [Candidatus Aminicenantia bacterium]